MRKILKNLMKRSYPVRLVSLCGAFVTDRVGQYLDPFSGAKKRDLFWGLVMVFKRSLLLQSLLLVALVCSLRPAPR